MKKDKSINLELMRIVSMLLIVLWHILLHGKVFENCTNSILLIVLEVLRYIIIIHVNSFILLSGYFQSKSKFKTKKLIDLILQVMFYSIGILIFAIGIGWLKDCSKMTIINSILPSCISHYWFIACYIILYVFSDYINKFVDNLSKTEYKKFLYLAFIVLSIIPFITGNRVLNNTGYNFYNFIFLYIIGAYLRKYPLNKINIFKKNKKSTYNYFLIIGFFLFAFINYLLYFLISKTNGINGLFNEIFDRLSVNTLGYSNPFIIIQSIFYFEIFKIIRIKNQILSKTISIISGCVFGVYLFHDNPIIRDNIYRVLKIDIGPYSSYKFILYIFMMVIVIFVIGIIIELMRQLIFKFVKKLV